MDAHTENIVCDGEDIYLTDFGLAISDTFELSACEHAFFERHHCFDGATMLTSLLHAIFTRHAAECGWRDALRAFLDEWGPPFDEMPDADRDFLSCSNTAFGSRSACCSPNTERAFPTQKS